MKKTTLVLALVFAAGAAFAQKKLHHQQPFLLMPLHQKMPYPGQKNKTVIGSIDTQTGAVAFEAAVKNFAFSNPKIQEHFNAPNWMSSDQFPKFTFTGTIDKVNKVKFDKNGTYTVKVNGNLTVKGISKPSKVQGTVTVADGKIKVAANFKIKLEDYNITGQPIEAGKIDKEPKITVSAEF